MTSAPGSPTATPLRVKASLGRDFASLCLNDDLADISFLLPTSLAGTAAATSAAPSFPASAHDHTEGDVHRHAGDTGDEGQSSGDEKVPAHRLVLAARSPVFRSMLFGSFAERDKGEIRIPDISASVFRSLLHYMYTDEVCMDPSTVIELLYAAKKYALTRLCEGCVSYLEERIAAGTVCSLLSQAHVFSEEALAGMCMQFLRENVEILLQDSTKEDLSREALLQVITDDFVCLPEIAIFKLVMDWVDHQREVENKPADAPYSEDAADLIAHIRFPLMSEQELSANVVPRRVLSDTVLVEIFVHKALPRSNYCRFKSLPRQISFKTKHILYRSGKQVPNAIGNWGFSGAIDAVSVKVDKPIWLHGFGLFPGNGGGLTGTIKVHAGDSAQTGALLGEAHFANLASRGEDVEHVLFATPIPIEPDTVYTLIECVESTQIRSKQFQGTRHGSSCIPMEGVAFVFLDSINSSNNGTGPFGGQIPALVWSSRSAASTKP